MVVTPPGTPWFNVIDGNVPSVHAYLASMAFGARLADEGNKFWTVKWPDRQVNVDSTHNPTPSSSCTATTC
jgi:hypothetical protein